MYGNLGRHRPRSKSCPRATPRRVVLALIGSLAGLFGATAGALASDHDTCVGEGMPPPGGVEFLRSYHPGVAGPSRLAGDGIGNILVADPARNQVIVRAPDGRVLERRTFSTPPVALAVDSRSPGAPVIYVGDGADGSVVAYSADWQPMFALGQGAGEFQSVNDIAVSALTGDVFVADGAADVIKVYAAGGAPLGSFGGHGSEAGLFDFPVALAIDDMRGEILVADQMNFRVQIFDLQGNIICRIGDNGGARSGSIFIGTRLFTTPQGLAVDEAGRIYVADAAEGRIRVIDRDGAKLAQIGGCGQLGLNPSHPGGR